MGKIFTPLVGSKRLRGLIQEGCHGLMLSREVIPRKDGTEFGLYYFIVFPRYFGRTVILLL